jgi:hypothetical protein
LHKYVASGKARAALERFIATSSVGMGISLDIPAQMLKNLDREATRIGVARQALIKVWLAERLDIISS